MGDEKRRFCRIPFDCAVEIEVEGRTFVTDRISNLSVGGCLVALDEAVSPGAACRFLLTLSGDSSGRKVEVFGSIQRFANGMAAIRFDRIDPDSLYHLQNIVRYNAPDADIIEEEISRHPGLK